MEDICVLSEASVDPCNLNSSSFKDCSDYIIRDEIFPRITAVSDIKNISLVSKSFLIHMRKAQIYKHVTIHISDFRAFRNFFSCFSFETENCEKLNFRKSRMLDEHLNALAHFQSVKSLSLEGCEMLSTGALISYFRMNPQIQKLNLVGCQGADDSVMRELAQSCPNLRKINISLNFLISDDILLYLTENLEKLEEVHLQGKFDLNLHLVLQILAVLIARGSQTIRQKLYEIFGFEKIDQEHDVFSDKDDFEEVYYA